MDKEIRKYRGYPCLKVFTPPASTSISKKEIIKLSSHGQKLSEIMLAYIWIFSKYIYFLLCMYIY